MEHQTGHEENKATSENEVEQPSAAPAEVKKQTAQKVTMPEERVETYDLEFDLAAQTQFNRDPESSQQAEYWRQRGADNVARYNMPRAGITDEDTVQWHMMQSLSRVSMGNVAVAIASACMANGAPASAFATTGEYMHGGKKKTDVILLTKRTDLGGNAPFEGRCFFGPKKGEYVDVYIDNTMSRPAPPAGYLVGVSSKAQPATVAAAVRGELYTHLVPSKCTAQQFDELQMRVVVRGGGGGGRTVAVRVRGGEALQSVRRALGMTQRMKVLGTNVGFAQNPRTALALDKDLEPELALYNEHVVPNMMVSVRYDAMAAPLWSVDLNRMAENLRVASNGKATVVDLVQGNESYRGGWRHLNVTLASPEELRWVFDKEPEDGWSLPAAFFGDAMARALGEGQIIIEPWRQSGYYKQNEDRMSKSAASGGKGFASEQDLDGFLQIDSDCFSLTHDIGVTDEMRRKVVPEQEGAATQAAMADDMDEDTAQLRDGLEQLDLSSARLSPENTLLVRQMLAAQREQCEILMREQAATMTTLLMTIQNFEQAQGQQDTEQAPDQQNTEQHKLAWTEDAAALANVRTEAPMTSMAPRIPIAAPKLPCKLTTQPKSSALKRTAAPGGPGNSPVRKVSGRGGQATASITYKDKNRKSQPQQNTQPPSPPVIQREPAQAEQNSASSSGPAG